MHAKNARRLGCCPASFVPSFKEDGEGSMTERSAEKIIGPQAVPIFASPSINDRERLVSGSLKRGSCLDDVVAVALLLAA
jgi:hypothetical protein